MTRDVWQVAFVAGVADASGYGWAIAKQLANAGATIIVGTWPPVMTLFERGLKKGFGEDGLLKDGTAMKIDKVYALDGKFALASSTAWDSQRGGGKLSLPAVGKEKVWGIPSAGMSCWILARRRVDRLCVVAAMFSNPSEVDEETKANKRYAGLESFDIE